MYYYSYKAVLKAQKKYGGVIWYDQNKKAYYLLK